MCLQLKRLLHLQPSGIIRAGRLGEHYRGLSEKGLLVKQEVEYATNGFFVGLPGGPADHAHIAVSA